MMTAAEAFQMAGQYYQSGQHGPAEQLYHYALQLDPNHAAALYGLGVLAAQGADWAQAAVWLRRAAEASPGVAEYWHDLAVAYSKIGHLAEAAAACEHALLVRPHYAVAANDLGQLYKEMGDIERALGCYGRALRLQPDYADAHVNLASALIECERLEEAVAHYRQALRIQPGHVHAYYTLSHLMAEGKYSLSAADLEQLRRLVAADRLPILDRSVAAFALATALDAQGAYDEAFAFYRQANALRRDYQWTIKRAFDAELHRQAVDEVIATFDRAYFQKVRGWGSESELPFFILGMPRSGTSLVEQILASHPAVYGAGELSEIPQLLARLTKMPPGSGIPRPQAFASSQAAKNLAAGYLERITQLASSKKSASRVTNKDLSNVLYLGLIATLFPRARLIACRRDPRDVCLSCYFQNFQYMNFSWSLEEIAFYQGQHERLMAHWRKVLPLPIHEVCYEELVTNQEPVTRELLAHCGLEWDERCLAFYKSRRAVLTASAVQVRKPMSTKSVGRWKHYQRHLGPLLKELQINGIKLSDRQELCTAQA